MGIYIRKSISFGPVRINFSKSGLGASVGVKGARVSAGPRGTYLHLGRYGVYYQQRIDLHNNSPGTNGGVGISQRAHTQAELNQEDLIPFSPSGIASEINRRAKTPGTFGY